MNKNIPASVVCVVAVLAVGIWFVYDQYIPKSPPPPLSGQATTEPTKAIQNELYLVTDPSEWFSQDETVNWNDQLLVTVERVTVSSTLPHDVDTMTEMFYYGFDHYQKLVDNDADTLFIDLTLCAECIGLPSGSLFGVAVDEPLVHVCAGQMAITYYDPQNGQLTSYDDEVNQGCLVAVQDLTGNHADFVDYYPLAVGDTARFRTLFIINRTQWDSGTVLLTPALGLYGAEQLQWLRYDQPHLVLNSKEMN